MIEYNAHVLSSFWSRVLKFSVPSSALRLRKSLEEYIEAVCVEASDREELAIRGIQEYLQIRRGSAATRSIFLIGSLHVEIPDEVMEHPKVESLTVKCMDLVVIHNDLYSYNFERKHGIHGHNLITAIMKEKRLDIQGSFNYAGKMFQQIGTAFLQDIKRIPKFGSKVDKALHFHLEVMCNWIIGMEEWTFRSERYFGKQRFEVRRTRTVELAPEPLRRQYDLMMDHLNTVSKTSDLTSMSRVIIRATGLDSLLRFTVPIAIYYCFTLLIYNVRN
ncbi:hypothetical protein Clacol_009320 [Clathrus columnatus]|uniref:Terpene synthase n=1 Tax=Clathrus columnatus TaxID=1419009 RepID=A0AAV5AKV2_9AGAM|nr:hypothetical protein Clacol_009320 [Clathrus columnatus]